MNGAEAAFRAAAALGVEVCFANPGTTEMELVAAVDAVDEIRGILGLFEGVVTGAADGYARIAGKPALTLLHLGPGFANGLANLHNARRAHSPIINLVGDHASWHLDADAPLTSDIDSLAHPMSVSVQRVVDADVMADAMRTAYGNAMSAPTGPATLVIPQDSAWDETTEVDVAPFDGPDVSFDSAAVLGALAHEGNVAILLGGRVDADALHAAARIAGVTGARVLVDTFPALLAAGHGIPSFDQVPYFPEQAVDALADLDAVVAIGTRAPVAFFGYQSTHRSSLLPEACRVVECGGPGAPTAALATQVAALLSAPDVDVDERPMLSLPAGDLDMFTMGQTVAALQPEGAIIVNEAATSGLGWAMSAPAAQPHVSLALTGGAIGQGLPCAVGAAVAAPDRKVIALEADGSGMYTLQALWTMAREGLDVVVVVCANQAYRILQMELHRTGHDHVGAAGRSLTDLGNPPLDWVGLATGMGVDAVRVETVDALADALRVGLDTSGPYLVEAYIP